MAIDVCFPEPPARGTGDISVRKQATVPPASHNPYRRNYGLDLIRSLAICLVLFAHFTTKAPACGVLGVELFFVLSGFLIGGILYQTLRNQDPIHFRDIWLFWKRRWMRTLPNYYLFLAVAIAMFPSYGNTRRPDKHLALSAVSAKLESGSWCALFCLVELGR